MSMDQPTKDLESLRILVGEDEADTQDLIKRVLEQGGAIVSTASDGAESVEKACAQKFDLILLDIEMPKLDGFSAAELLRQRGIRSPMIALSAHDLPGDVFNAHVAGFNGHISKPINLNLFIPEILRLIESIKPSS